MAISKKATDLIVSYEVGSKKLYEQKYQRPVWPGASSGVTIGIGYDVGYQTKTQLWKDWEGKIPNDMIALLETAVGVTGAAAKPLAAKLAKEVKVPWDAAYAVFESSTLPRFEKSVVDKLPNTNSLSPDSFGALVSLAYNRGPSFNLKGERYTEMRNIKTHMVNKDFGKIPAEIRAMTRIWKGTTVENGLTRRRNDEAKLFEDGLKPVIKPIETPKDKAKAGTAGTVAGGVAGTVLLIPQEYWMYAIPAVALAALLVYFIVKKKAQ